MNHSRIPSLTLALLLWLASPLCAEHPNVVFILTDNHGAWTLGCYGNPDIRTPHIDRLAAEGMLFSRAMSSNPVCSPTRATYLTGLIPSQHGLHSFLDNKYMVGPEAYYTLEEFQTLPEILHSEGYACGLVGKWHLGANMTPQDGFSCWITMVRGSTRNFYDDMIIQDGEIKKTPKYSHFSKTPWKLVFTKSGNDAFLRAWQGSPGHGRFAASKFRRRNELRWLRRCWA